MPREHTTCLVILFNALCEFELAFSCVVLLGKKHSHVGLLGILGIVGSSCVYQNMGLVLLSCLFVRVCAVLAATFSSFEN